MEAGVRREGLHAEEEWELALGTVCADREETIGLTIDKLTLAVPRDQTGWWGRKQGAPWEAAAAPRPVRRRQMERRGWWGEG